jgi:membrane associated rhomboid family serine protease
MSAQHIITPMPSAFGGSQPHRIIGTLSVVTILVSVTMAQSMFGPAVYREAIETFGLRAAVWTWGDPASYIRMVSYAFVHGSGGHFFWNTIMLLLVGSVVEMRLGWRTVCGFLIMGSIAAAAAHLLIFPAEARPLIGASGAVSTLLGVAFIIAGQSGFKVYMPFTRLLLLVTLRRVLLVWLALQVVSAVLVFLPGQPPAGVAYWGHVAGFFAGAAGALAYRRIAPAAHTGAARATLVESFAGAGD